MLLNAVMPADVAFVPPLFTAIATPFHVADVIEPE
jgi:hypothetical protein